MTLTAALRVVALAAGVVGLFDPSWRVSRPVPVPLDVVIGGDAHPDASKVKDELVRRIGGDAQLNSANQSAAAIVIGSPVASVLERDRPVSTIALPPAKAPNVRIADIRQPDPVRVGWAATVRATFEGQGVVGRTTRVLLEDRGVEVARLDHNWTTERERFDAMLRYSPSTPATSVLTVRAAPIEGESTTDDNVAHLRLVASDAPLRVLVHEYRPSWSTAFVRRALEGDPTFSVSSIVQSSKGLMVRAGDAPAALTSDVLERYDVVLAGAPEDLRAADIDAIRSFVERRGGTVIFVPDRKPSGRYLDLLPSPLFDEVLIEAPAELQTGSGPFRASELALYRGTAEVEPLASYKRENSSSPVVFQVLSGEGRIVFSGAMDAWRHRAATDDGFARFWRTRVAEAALAAPPRLDIDVTPSVPGAEEAFTITARLRPTEWEEGRGGVGGAVRMPRISGRLVDGTGRVVAVRFWPTEEPGTFVGRVAVAAGRYDVSVSAEGGASTDQVVDVLSDAAHAGPEQAHTAETLDLLAQATGGVAVRADDLAPLERHVRGMATQYEDRVVRPARSPLLLLVFAAAACAEWAVRRRGGRA